MYLYQWPGFKFNLRHAAFIVVGTSMPGNIFMRCQSKLKSTLPLFTLYFLRMNIFKKS